MKAAVIQPDYSLKIEEIPTPEPSTDDILIKVSCCGICGSDLHFLTSKTLPPGVVIGHELSGYIEAVGPDVTEWFKGDKVVAMPFDPCLACKRCKAGDTHHCKSGMSRSYGLGIKPGAFSEYMLVKPNMLYKIPENLDMKTASLTEPLAVALRAVNMSKIKNDEPVLVMGAGPIGVLTVQALKLSGVNYIFVSEPDPYRAEKSVQAGATKAFDPNKVLIGNEITRISGSLPGTVFECAGTASSMQEAALLVKSLGQIIMLGVHQGNVTIFPLIWFPKEINLRFSFGYTMAEFEQSLNILAGAPDIYETVVSDDLPLSQINKAFHLLRSPGHSKIIINCTDD